MTYIAYNRNVIKKNMKAIEVVSIPVSDQQRSKAFYLSIGFVLVLEAPMDEKANWIQLGLPNGGASITLVTWFPKMPPGSFQGLVIATDDIAKDREFLSTKGVAVGLTDETPWGKFAQITDPDGNGLTLHQK
ncbi:MAG: Glyoxalase-like domain protein [Chitinophagaceae bacterium]|nr:Glyoxalase-like domain protein [Chitinophagaceae bacterium]